MRYDDGVKAYTTDAAVRGRHPQHGAALRARPTAPGCKEDLGRYQNERPCETCHGRRLKPEALAVKIDKRDISQVSRLLDPAMPCEWFGGARARSSPPSSATSPSASSRRSTSGSASCSNVGLEYLTLSRASGTLSGGESQRIRLASQIGSGLTGVLYVLDEPSIGLHQRDNDRLLATLKRLRDLGNTVIVVEHDEEAIRAADYLIDMGPGAGIHGGHVVAAGHARRDHALARTASPAQYLTGRRQHRGAAHAPHRPARPGADASSGARANNLQNIDRRLPARHLHLRHRRLGRRQIDAGHRHALQGAGAQRLKARASIPAPHDRIEGAEHLDKIVDIDQSPIGRTPRSNPATYTGAFTPMRDWFAGLARSQGARLWAGPLLVQRQGRALRSLPGRRRHQDRDALPARRLCAMRRLQGQALQPRNARSHVQGQEHRRRARHDGRGRRRVLPRRAGDPRQARDAWSASGSATSISASRRRRSRAARRSA